MIQKLILTVAIFFASELLFASFTISSTVVAKKEVTIDEVSKMSFREFRKHTIHKSGFKNRMAFLMLKKEMKQQAREGNGAINIAPVLDHMMDDARFRFKLIGFAAGLFLGIFGVGLTYIFSKDRNLHKSAWIGFGVLTIVAVISLFSIFPG